jgi:hypothetical protein
VKTSGGDRAFVDLADSRLYVSHVGEELTVVLPPAGGNRDVALPPDVLAASHQAVYVDAAWAPGVCVLVSVTAAALCFWRPRRWRSASTPSTSG